jgi:hypothetical protein
MKTFCDWIDSLSMDYVNLTVIIIVVVTAIIGQLIIDRK